MFFKSTLFRAILRQTKLRFMSLKSKDKNHYKSLGIPSTSTQSEVKSAYYKLSMMYHPDKNKGNEESSQKFRDISEAYEVLGNVKTRKMYDKGLYFGSGATADAAEDALHRFYQSREHRSRPPPPTGRQPIYDFDEWSKHHYGATFRRHMENRRKRQAYETNLRQEANDAKVEQLVFMFGLVMLLCMYFFRDQTYDTDRVSGAMPLGPDRKD